MRRIYDTWLITAFHFCFLLEYTTLSQLFFHCLDIAEKIHGHIEETKAMVKEIHQAVKIPDNCQGSPITPEDRIGRL